jgi:hypothetical protein
LANTVRHGSRWTVRGSGMPITRAQRTHAPLRAAANATSRSSRGARRHTYTTVAALRLQRQSRAASHHSARCPPVPCPGLAPYRDLVTVTVRLHTVRLQCNVTVCNPGRLAMNSIFFNFSKFDSWQPAGNRIFYFIYFLISYSVWIRK